MAADDKDLFGVFSADYFTYDIGRGDGAGGNRILNINVQPNARPHSQQALNLFLILSSHAHDGYVKVTGKPQYPGMRQFDPCRLRASLSADHGDGVRLMGRN